MKIIFHDKLFKLSVTSYFNHFELLLSQKVSCNTLDIHNPWNFCKLGCTVQAQEYHVPSLYPFIPISPTLKA